MLGTKVINLQRIKTLVLGINQRLTTTPSAFRKREAHNPTKLGEFNITNGPHHMCQIDKLDRQ
jgi:hypothetical protein